MRKEGFAAGKQPAAQGEQAVAHVAAGENRTGGQGRKAAGRERRAGKERTGEHEITSLYDAVKETEKWANLTTYSLQRGADCVNKRVENEDKKEYN